jgi:hypothetical protein
MYNSCNCAVPEVVNIPGMEGDSGPAGTNGQPAFTATTAAATFPDTATPVVVSVLNSTWMAVGQIVFLSDGTNFASCVVTAVSYVSPTVVTLTWQNYNGDSGAPVTVGLGASVVPAGRQIATPVTVPNGGTGAATLTGLVLGNGAGAMTAVNYHFGAPQVATGATAVVVLDANITANSVVIFTLKTVGGTPAGAPYLSAVTAGTGFSFKAVAGDTSTYNYVILN